MEVVGRIKEASLDINTIGLYDADLERERIEMVLEVYHLKLELSVDLSKET